MARYYTRREEHSRRLTFKIFAGMFDFVGILAGLVVIAACVILLSALYNWVLRDVQASFSTLWDIFTSAIIVPK